MESKKQTTIIRAPRDKEHPYFSLRRKTAQDTRLSFEARGALAYLLSKPGDWDINEEDLMREGSCGRDRVRRILRELKTCGYLIREKQTFGEKHRFNPVVLVVQEFPCPENPSTDSGAPSTENPSTDEPITGEPSTENPTHTEYKESQKDGSEESALGVEQKTEEPKTEETSTTTESVPPARDGDAPLADVVVDGEGDADDQAGWDLVRTDVAALCLSPAMETALRALGPVSALAIAMAADKPGVKSPSGLAVSLIKNPANLAPALLDQAEQKLATRAAYRPETLYRDASEETPEDDLAARQQDHAQLQAEARQIVQDAGQDDPPAAPELLPDPPVRALEQPAAPVTMTPVGTIVLPPVEPSAGRFPAQALWRSALNDLEHRVGRLARENYFELARGVNLEGSVLTLQASSGFVRGVIRMHRETIEQVLSTLAGMGVSLNVVSEWPQTLVLNGAAR